MSITNLSARLAVTGEPVAIAHLFAGRLAATPLPFDRLQFLAAATEASRHA